MPFFLVTQTSLIEANDENEAARNAINRIRSGNQVTVTVKSDETTISHIVVAAEQNISPVLQIADLEMKEHKKGQASDLDATIEPNGRLTVNRILRGALALVRWRS